MNLNIYIRNPFPFRAEERMAIQEALQRTYTHNLVYLTHIPQKG